MGSWLDGGGGGKVERHKRLLQLLCRHRRASSPCWRLRALLRGHSLVSRFQATVLVLPPPNSIDIDSPALPAGDEELCCEDIHWSLAFPTHLSLGLG